jgi:REP element-mobilizing transposase RayT
MDKDRYTPSQRRVPVGAAEGCDLSRSDQKIAGCASSYGICALKYRANAFAVALRFQQLVFSDQQQLPGDWPMPEAAQGCHLRKGRVSEPGRIYLLTAVICQRRPVFKDWRLGRLLVNQLRSAEEASMVTSLAWVVMPDHVHWLAQLHGDSLAGVMGRIKSRSGRAVNRDLGSEGQLWQRGYYDRALRKDEDLKDAARYIINNPLRAGLVTRIGDYPLWDAIWV